MALRKIVTVGDPILTKVCRRSKRSRKEARTVQGERWHRLPVSMAVLKVRLSEWEH